MQEGTAEGAACQNRSREVETGKRQTETHPWRNSVNDFGNKREVPSVIKTFDYSCVEYASRVNLKQLRQKREN